MEISNLVNEKTCQASNMSERKVEIFSVIGEVETSKTL